MSRIAMYALSQTMVFWYSSWSRPTVISRRTKITPSTMLWLPGSFQTSMPNQKPSPIIKAKIGCCSGLQPLLGDHLEAQRAVEVAGLTGQHAVRELLAAHRLERLDREDAVGELRRDGAQELVWRLPERRAARTRRCSIPAITAALTR